MRHEEQMKHLIELRQGKTFVDSNLDCGQAYTVYKFHPEVNLLRSIRQPLQISLPIQG